MKLAYHSIDKDESYSAPRLRFSISAGGERFSTELNFDDFWKLREMIFALKPKSDMDRAMLLALLDAYSVEEVDNVVKAGIDGQVFFNLLREQGVSKFGSIPLEWLLEMSKVN